MSRTKWPRDKVDLSRDHSDNGLADLIAQAKALELLKAMKKMEGKELSRAEYGLYAEPIIEAMAKLAQEEAIASLLAQARALVNKKASYEKMFVSHALPVGGMEWAELGHSAMPIIEAMAKLGEASNAKKD